MRIQSLCVFNQIMSVFISLSPRETHLLPSPPSSSISSHSPTPSRCLPLPLLISPTTSETVVHKTEVKKVTLNPNWDAFTIPVRSLCNGDYDRYCNLLLVMSSINIYL